MRFTMRNFLAASVFAALASFVAGTALAAEGGDGHGSPVRDLAWQAFNMALLLSVIVYAARKPVLEFFAGRRSAVKSEIDEASEVLAEAETRFSEWQRKVVEVEGELEEIRATARLRAEQERETILADARDAAERIQRNATASVEQELRRAKAQLREEAADLATELAAQLLAGQIGDSDRDRLVDEFISRVEDGAGAAEAQ